MRKEVQNNMRRDRRRSAGAPPPQGSGAFRRGRESAVKKSERVHYLPRRKAAHAVRRMGEDRRRYLRMLLRFNRFRRGVCDCF